jgi:hypothetical protein
MVMNVSMGNRECEKLHRIYVGNNESLENFDVNFLVKAKLKLAGMLTIHPSSFAGPPKTKYTVPSEEEKASALQLEHGVFRLLEPTTKTIDLESISLQNPLRWDLNDQAFGVIDFSKLPSPKLIWGVEGFGIVCSIVLFILGVLLSICVCFRVCNKKTIAGSARYCELQPKPKHKGWLHAVMRRAPKTKPPTNVELSSGESQINNKRLSQSQRELLASRGY